MGLLQSEVNKKNSNTWNRCNTDAKSGFFRNYFISKNGGSFSKTSSGWVWEEPKPEEPKPEEPKPEEPKPEEPIKLIVPTPEPKKESGKIVIFEDAEGVRYEVKNISSFCKEKNLSNSTIYDLIAKRRKTHKGFKYIETIEPTE